PSGEVLAVEIGDRFLRGVRSRHLDEAESTRLTAHAIDHQVDGLHLSGYGKVLCNEVLGGVIGQVAHVQATRHQGGVLDGSGSEGQAPGAVRGVSCDRTAVTSPRLKTEKGKWCPETNVDAVYHSVCEPSSETGAAPDECARFALGRNRSRIAAPCRETSQRNSFAAAARARSRTRRSSSVWSVRSRT